MTWLSIPLADEEVMLNLEWVKEVRIRRTVESWEVHVFGVDSRDCWVIPCSDERQANAVFGEIRDATMATVIC